MIAIDENSNRDWEKRDKYKKAQEAQYTKFVHRQGA